MLLKEYLGVYLREKGVADADPAEVQRSIQDRYVRALQAGARKDLGEAR